MNTMRQPSDADPGPVPDFTARVMSSVATDPGPSVRRSFAAALRERSFDEARAALAVAWRLAAHGRRVPLVVRLQALALVILVVLSLGAGAAAAGTVAYRVGPIVTSLVRDDHPDDRQVPSGRSLEPPANQPTPAVTEPSQPAADGTITDRAYDDERVGEPGPEDRLRHASSDEPATTNDQADGDAPQGRHGDGEQDDVDEASEDDDDGGDGPGGESEDDEDTEGDAGAPDDDADSDGDESEVDGDESESDGDESESDGD